MYFRIVPCAIGTYYIKEKQICAKCPSGTYQSETGQLQCTACPIIAGRPGITITSGARSASQCKGESTASQLFFLGLFLSKLSFYFT